jgi:glycosyltransferase involved in cell wall biosynthesis
MKGNDVDLSVVWFVESQKHLLYSALVSIERAVNYASDANISTEILIVSHRSDDETASWLAQRNTYPVMRNTEGCLGTARNRSAQECRGKHVAFVDGTDLCSRNFLVAALNRDVAATKRTVWRPFASLGFSDQYSRNGLFSLRLVPEPGSFDPLALLHSNPYPSMFVTRRNVLLDVPFPREDKKRGWNHVDGWWCANLAGAGIEQRPVADTLHYFRTTHANAAAQTGTARRLGPTTLELGNRRQAQWYR